ncbi:MAG: DUF3786 domain-containing protein [Armatimonadota bacterium]
MSQSEPISEPGRFPIPPKQRPYALALNVSFDALLAREQTPERLAALGATRDGDIIRLPALNQHLLIDLEARDVLVDGHGRAHHNWALLALHYLDADDLTVDAREVTLTHFADARGYLSVYNGRIIGRFLGTVGRTDAGFRQAAESVGAVSLALSGTSYRFDVFPRLPITVIRYEGDEDFPPGANIVYRADAGQLLPAEDRIVIAEVIIDSLSGKAMFE